MMTDSKKTDVGMPDTEENRTETDNSAIDRVLAADGARSAGYTLFGSGSALALGEETYDASDRDERF